VAHPRLADWVLKVHQGSVSSILGPLGQAIHSYCLWIDQDLYLHGRIWAWMDGGKVFECGSAGE
jgi:hypothetical protein